MLSYPGIEAPHLHLNLGLVNPLMAQEPDLKRAMDLDLENELHLDLLLVVRAQQAMYLHFM